MKTCKLCPTILTPQAESTGICTPCWWKTSGWLSNKKRPIRTGMGR